ncbi:C45 family autoproteolytic acyltransferase/hydolase [Salisediminibacterium beveridgei]|uniref:Peptidase n=1 Tax=Salisediminibacterium beveridgei TaxID=632773 RepID=A0A1D7QVC8_9BACI|nr:C45 family peptidase [Salisediminibacterium beveridgei]AOM82970.1 Peptidase [Salisediminibacterium beveridgei]
MDIGVDIIKSREDAYLFGYHQGLALKKMPVYQKHVKRRKKSIRQYTVNVAEFNSWMADIQPSLLDELEGLSQALGWRLEDTIHEYGGYQDHWKRSGCSAMMPDGLYARNYDYHPKTYDGRFVLYQPQKGYGHIGFAQRIIGRMDGMNQKGLAIGYHFVNRLKPGKGFICTTITRLVLENCKDVPEAIRMLKYLPHRFAFNFSVADRFGNAAVVEASSKGVFIHNNDIRICSNHFRSDEKAWENRHFLEETTNRLHNLNEGFVHHPNPLDLFYKINHTKHQIAKTDYRNFAGTIHSVVYDTVTQHVYVGLGVNTQPLLISFGDWINGAPLYFSKLKGKLPDIEGAEHLRRFEDAKKRQHASS